MIHKNDTGFSLNNAPPKIVATKGTSEFFNFTSVQNGRMLQCKRFSPPFGILKGNIQAEFVSRI